MRKESHENTHQASLARGTLRDVLDKEQCKKWLLTKEDLKVPTERIAKMPVTGRSPPGWVWVGRRIAGGWPWKRRRAKVRRV